MIHASAMLSYYFYVFLLALTFGGNAHGLLFISSTHAKVLVTSSLKSGVNAEGVQSTQSQQNLLSLEYAIAAQNLTASCVVQNWSLVCKQLCGVGLGGAPCAATCTTRKLPTVEPRKNDDDDELQIKRDLICKDLCAIQMGGNACTCNTAAPKKSITTNERNVVCQTFCAHNGKTVPGCSFCNRSTNINKENIIKPETGIAADGTSNTTPNWSELCTELCRTGDGGSLCNCDLSPFY